PVLKPRVIRAGTHKILKLHDLEFAEPKDESPGRNLIPKRLADLSDSEWQLLSRRCQHALEVDKDSLGRLGPEVGRGRLTLNRSNEGLEHRVEEPRLAQDSPTIWTDRASHVLLTKT